MGIQSQLPMAKLPKQHTSWDVDVMYVKTTGAMARHRGGTGDPQFNKLTNMPAFLQNGCASAAVHSH